MLGGISTWLGDHLGVLRVVGLQCYCFLSLEVKLLISVLGFSFLAVAPLVVIVVVVLVAVVLVLVAVVVLFLLPYPVAQLPTLHNFNLSPIGKWGNNINRGKKTAPLRRDWWARGDSSKPIFPSACDEQFVISTLLLWHQIIRVIERRRQRKKRAVLKALWKPKARQNTCSGSLNCIFFLSLHTGKNLVPNFV